MRGSTCWLTLAAITGLSLVACGQAPEPPSGPASATITAAVRPTSTANLQISMPTQDQRIAGPTTELKVRLTGAEIVPQTSTDLRPDEGHLHVYLDGTLVSMTSSTETTLRNLTPGTHLVKVEFVANDHAPFDPRVIAAAAFEVEP